MHKQMLPRILYTLTHDSYQRQYEYRVALIFAQILLRHSRQSQLCIVDPSTTENDTRGTRALHVTRMGHRAFAGRPTPKINSVKTCRACPSLRIVHRWSWGWPRLEDRLLGLFDAREFSRKNDSWATDKQAFVYAQLRTPWLCTVMDDGMGKVAWCVRGSAMARTVLPLASGGQSRESCRTG
jgi:hypothetical protein